MKITIIGTGYVGLVTGTCFAELGHDVICVDNNQDKIDKLNQGIMPIYELGLSELVERNSKQDRLIFTTDIQRAIEESLFIFIAVGTPSNDQGSADLQYVEAVAHSIGQHMNDFKVVVNKSTVPVGTADKVRATVSKALSQRDQRWEFDVVSNPEFLKEGDAIRDFLKPDRIIIGVDNIRTATLMKELYSTLFRTGHRLIVMDVRSAEMSKYASNAMLATRISFMNEMANLCDRVGADIQAVRLGIGSDSRIGNKFLFPGVGYGGSCFPKDIKALIDVGAQNDHDMHILNAVETVNEQQKLILFKKVMEHFDGKLKGKTFGIWGLAFKPNTDDMREAPSLSIIKQLVAEGATIKAHDPESLEEAQRYLPPSDQLIYKNKPYQVAEDADALLLVTEWSIFRNPDFDKLKTLLKKPLIFDGRNQYDPHEMQKHGFTYYTIGRDHASDSGKRNGFL